jgi:hypothetical protein
MLSQYAGNLDEKLMETLCGTCAHAREIVSGTGSRFLLCQMSQKDRRYPKYPPQPVRECAGFKPQDHEDRDRDRS